MTTGNWLRGSGNRFPPTMSPGATELLAPDPVDQILSSSRTFCCARLLYVTHVRAKPQRRSTTGNPAHPGQGLAQHHPHQHEHTHQDHRPTPVLPGNRRCVAGRLEPSTFRNLVVALSYPTVVRYPPDSEPPRGPSTAGPLLLDAAPLPADRLPQMQGQQHAHQVDLSSAVVVVPQGRRPLRALRRQGVD